MANIFAQFMQPVRSVDDYRGDMEKREALRLDIDAGRRKNAMDAMTMQQGIDKRNALSRIAAGWTPQATIQQRIESLRSDPLAWGEADALEKSAMEKEKTGAEIRSKDAATAEQHQKLFKAAVGMVVSNPAPETVDAVLRDLEAVTGRGMGPARQFFANARTPEEIATVAKRIGLELDKQLPTFADQNRGGTVATTRRDPVTGAVTDVQTAQVTQTPDSIARSEDAAKARAQAAGQFAETKKLQRERFEFDKTEAGKPKPVAATKPMPAAALKMQDEDLNAIGTFAGIDADLAGIEKQIADGKLDLGLVNNVTGQARNYVGASNENSRNLATFKAKLENMRNSVLLLNKGVQTEGDAQRAMNEMIANINDPEVVKQRLAEIRALNQRAVMIKKNNVDMVRRNYGQEDMDYSRYEKQPPATNLPKAGALSPEDAQAREWATKNPNDPRAKQIMQRLGGG